MLTRNILDHLYATYANISPSDLQENETRFRAQYGANQPIETLIYQVENDVEYSAAGNTPYLPAQVVATANQIVFQTGLLTMTVRYGSARQTPIKPGITSRLISPLHTKNGGNHKPRPPEVLYFKAPILLIITTRLTPLRVSPHRPPATATPLQLSV